MYLIYNVDKFCENMRTIDIYVPAVNNINKTIKSLLINITRTFLARYNKMDNHTK